MHSAIAEEWDGQGGQEDEEEPPPLLPRELLQLSEDLCTSYVPARVTVDSHAEAWLNERSLCQGDRVFAEQVLYGCTRYKRLLDSFITAFYFHERYRPAWLSSRLETA